MSNHLGNVLTVINDIKLPISSGGVVVDGYLATIVSTADYSPFGVQLDGRTESADSYRFGFNGHEKDDELKGAGNHLSFGNMGYDSRIARRMILDPYSRHYPNLSSYSTFANSPIYVKDIDGNILRDPNGKIIYTETGKGGSVTIGYQQLVYKTVNVYTNDGTKVSVDLIVDVLDVTTGQSIKDNNTKNTYICHGHSMMDGLFIPNSQHAVSNTLVLDQMGRSDLTPAEVANALETDFSKIQDGDILVFYKNQLNLEPGGVYERGVVSHTAVWSESEGKYVSKNGYNAIATYTLEELQDVYGTHVGYFTPQGDRVVNVSGSDGPVYNTLEVDPNDVQNALQE